MKEVCPHANEDAVEFLYRLTQLSQPIRTNQLLILGCMGADHPLLRQIALEFDTKLIFIYRRWPGWYVRTNTGSESVVAVANSRSGCMLRIIIGAAMCSMPIAMSRALTG